MWATENQRGLDTQIPYTLVCNKNYSIEHGKNVCLVRARFKPIFLSVLIWIYDDKIHLVICGLRNLEARTLVSKKDYSLVLYDAVYFDRCLSTFRKNLLSALLLGYNIYEK